MTPSPESSRIAAYKAAEAPVQTYVVVERYAATAYVHELTMPGFTEAEVVKHLIDCQWDEPHKVLFIDEAAGICRNVTAEIAEAILDRTNANANGDTLHEIVAEFCERAMRTAGQREAA